MTRTKLQDLPTKENTVTEPKQVVVNPLFAKPNTLASIFGISYSSVNRILKEWEKDSKGVDDLYYSLSSTMTVISIPRFEEYMKKRHKMDVERSETNEKLSNVYWYDFIYNVSSSISCKRIYCFHFIYFSVGIWN